MADRGVAVRPCALVDVDGEDRIGDEGQSADALTGQGEGGRISAISRLWRAGYLL